MLPGNLKHTPVPRERGRRGRGEEGHTRRTTMMRWQEEPGRGEKQLEAEEERGGRCRQLGSRMGREHEEGGRRRRSRTEEAEGTQIKHIGNCRHTCLKKKKLLQADNRIVHDKNCKQTNGTLTKVRKQTRSWDMDQCPATVKK